MDERYPPAAPLQRTASNIFFAFDIEFWDLAFPNFCLAKSADYNREGCCQDRWRLEFDCWGTLRTFYFKWYLFDICFNCHISARGMLPRQLVVGVWLLGNFSTFYFKWYLFDICFNCHISARGMLPRQLVVGVWLLVNEATGVVLKPTEASPLEGHAPQHPPTPPTPPPWYKVGPFRVEFWGLLLGPSKSPYFLLCSTNCNTFQKFFKVHESSCFFSF